MTAFPVMFYTVDIDINTTGGTILKKQSDEPYNPMYRSIADIMRITGLSRKYLRNGIQEGKFPYIMAGNTYMINYKKFMDILLKEESSH